MQLTFFDPGRMTARLQLERPVATPDGQGGATVAYETVAAVWARIEPAGHRILERASAETFALTHRIWIRHRANVEAGMRLRKGGRIFAIKAIRDHDETGRYLVCHCEEEGR
ncbi:phage head closure protein [Rhizobiaceae bacterium n13]|uniref:Phage head closure protein n=1 Tax=Ferirhizobium litorale TaxID=2927786 RepID=A0AAE3Q8W7_9HYPH|nr:phage head closure protein [Fererhizobium litorale]MDI7861265.1 phage head closure protein [Fererhizobium litorale]MDI7921412.1 phage head closure protein [Fererhizobium litorale]